MDWFSSGVNTTVPRNAGPECSNYLDPTWRIVETVIVLLFATICFIWSYKRIDLPTAAYVKKERGGRRILLVLMCIIWGIEIGYKFSSKTVIYLLNPCHVTTAIQVRFLYYYIYMLIYLSLQCDYFYCKLHKNFMKKLVLGNSVFSNCSKLPKTQTT